MSDTTETATDTDTGADASEISAEALEAVAQATACAEFEDALRPPPVPAGAEAEADTDTEDGAEDGEGDGEGTPNHEAAKWRTKLRDTEAERDALATRLEAMQRAAIDSHVTTMGMKPKALWASGAQLADLLGEDGTPDTAKVAAAVEAAKESLGVTVYTRPRQGLQPGAMSHQPRRDKWVEAFGPRDD
ncbi:hypothetical protein [Mycobacterium avium]|uniref:hypothetical protein n=1 Tax=Mycobacterium avium TaxID=1764 RepID=UPI001CC7E5AD|nr:hypothetical protein [Mycobacterium avium]MBZ4622125.1 hypothetical protein [Mycobacterium avium subsp. hominissuis]